MYTFRTLAMIAVVGSLGFASVSHADSGRFTSHYPWIFSGTIQELGADRAVYVGTLAGVNINDAGKGFLHKVRMDCTIINDVNKGQSNANGSCAGTDADGDKAYLVFKCGGTMPACPGEFSFSGGTGKYKGLTGNSKFQGNFIGTTGAGWSDWNGEYKQP